ncbi:MAG TPA: hypothetical protein VIF62_16675 [Labilithrix sp.]
MRSRTKLMVTAAAVVLTACKRELPHDEPRGEPAPSLTVRGAEAPAATPTVVPASPRQNLALEPAGDWEVATPHAVIYDASSDRYLVAATAAVVAIDPKTDAKPASFVANGKNGVMLRSPRALAVDGKGTLYVTDGDTVHMFDAKSGAPKGNVVMQGATSLEGIAASGDGRVFVADSGLHGPDDKKPASGAVFVIDGGKPKTIAKDSSLGHPTALAFDGDLLRVATWDGSIYVLSEDGKKRDAIDTPRGQLDGLVVIKPFLWISSWKDRAVFRGLPTGNFAAPLPDLDTPGGLGYDQPRERLLVPLVSKNRVQAYGEVKR